MIEFIKNNQVKITFTFSIILILLQLFTYPIVDFITMILYFLISIFFLLIFLIIMIINLIYFFKSKNNLIIIKSLLIQITILIIFIFIPITNIWVKFNFWFYKSKRVEIIEKILQNSLTPNIEYNKSLIKLDNSYPTLSYGGNEVVVNKYNGEKYILFFMFRGILDNYTALLYIPKDGNIIKYKEHFMGKSSRIFYLENNWYYIED